MTKGTTTHPRPDPKVQSTGGGVRSKTCMIKGTPPALAMATAEFPCWRVHCILRVAVHGRCNAKAGMYVSSTGSQQTKGSHVRGITSFSCGCRLRPMQRSGGDLVALSLQQVKRYMGSAFRRSHPLPSYRTDKQRSGGDLAAFCLHARGPRLSQSIMGCLCDTNG